ncbi:probable prolyl 4-hydroxylase 9 isoform X3 [Herrania umbratica]|uniref:procollagen-proline 4-dioxygenase n=1 Tax=Herrania umbratica TaxID=108875 RepID=A0A6J0ZIL5_9ROSI|nr:probable prolyl 4-hydroxylase 9 isoform X3 [Herrania umbratica]
MSTSRIFDDYTPKMKTKGRAYLYWNYSRAKLGFPAVFLFCCLFFIAGFLSSSLRSQSQKEVSGVRQRGRQLDSVGYDLMAHGKTGDDSISIIPFQVISWRPRAFYFPKFATPEQCRHIINMARSNLEPSKLALRKEESEHKPQDVRTSMGTFLSASQDGTGILDAIEEKIAKATKLPRSHYEDFNVLRYELGQKYDSHLDAFPPEHYGPQKSQRVATFLVYLSDVEEGGETAFPYENGLNMDGSFDFKKCIGLKVKPRMGDGFLFYSLYPNNTIDPISLHGSCPVIKGEKWVVTKWIRDQQRPF